MSQTKTIEDLRAALFETIEGVRSGTLSIDKAKAIGDLAQVMVNTAKVEIAYLQANDGGESQFLNSAVGAANLPPGINGVTRHRLAG